MPDPFEPNELDPLQRAVHEALDLPVDDLAVERMRRAWRNARAEQNARRHRRVAMSAAAAVLTAAVLLSWSSPRREESAAQPPRPAETPDAIKPDAIEPSTKRPEPAPPAAVRAPTALEVAAFYSMTPHAKRRAIAVAAAPGGQATTVEQRVAALIARPTPDAVRRFARLRPKGKAYAALIEQFEDPAAQQLLWALVLDESERENARYCLVGAPESAIDGLFDQLGSDHGPERDHAAAVLAAIGGQRICDRLIRLAEDQPREVGPWLALANCRHQSAQWFLAYAARQPRLLGFMNAAQARLLASVN